MASILQWRPHTGPTARPRADIVVAQDCHDLGDALPDTARYRRRLTEVVNETAVRALIDHPVILMPSSPAGTVPDQSRSSGPRLEHHVRQGITPTTPRASRWSIRRGSRTFRSNTSTRRSNRLR